MFWRSFTASCAHNAAPWGLAHIEVAKENRQNRTGDSLSPPRMRGRIIPNRRFPLFQSNKLGEIYFVHFAGFGLLYAPLEAFLGFLVFDR